MYATGLSSPTLGDAARPFRARFSLPGLVLGSRPILGPLSLDLAAGEWVAVLGPSGIGKSSLLKAAAGLLPSGNLDRRAVAWMAQDPLLLPWRRVIDNVLIGAALRGEAPDRARAAALLARLGLGDWLDAWPHQLSGGMRQRVALARTLMEDRPLVLMDEPFSALDPINRIRLQDLAAETLADRAVLFVTHDPQEALRLADRIHILAGHPATLGPALEPAERRPRDPLAGIHLPLLRQVQAALLQADEGGA